MREPIAKFSNFNMIGKKKKFLRRTRRIPVYMFYYIRIVLCSQKSDISQCKRKKKAEPYGKTFLLFHFFFPSPIV